jgi:hypothetical protein
MSDTVAGKQPLISLFSSPEISQSTLCLACHHTHTNEHITPNDLQQSFVIQKNHMKTLIFNRFVLRGPKLVHTAHHLLNLVDARSATPSITHHSIIKVTYSDDDGLSYAHDHDWEKSHLARKISSGSSTFNISYAKTDDNNDDGARSQTSSIFISASSSFTDTEDEDEVSYNDENQNEFVILLNMAHLAENLSARHGARIDPCVSQTTLQIQYQISLILNF